MTVERALREIRATDRLVRVRVTKLELNDLWEPHGGEPPDDRHTQSPRDYSGASIKLAGNHRDHDRGRY